MVMPKVQQRNQLLARTTMSLYFLYVYNSVFKTPEKVNTNVTKRRVIKQYHL